MKLLTNEHVSDFPAPVFVGRQPESPQLALPKKNWPGITLTRMTNVRVLGNCNFIIRDGKAIHPDIYTPERDRSPIEMYGRARMDEQFKRIKISVGLTHGHLPVAVNLCDQTPYNYAHWLTEVLPKLALIEDIPELCDAPILVDHGLAENLLESIEALTGPGRKIIMVDRYDNICVDTLYNISPTSYCPHEFRDFFKTNQRGFQFFFSDVALNKLRDSLRRRYSKYANCRPRSIYLKRTTLWAYNDRNIINIDDIENIIDDFSIETINVSGMSIAHQARIFMNAKLIVAPTGAALANMIFAPPGCRIIVMAASYHGATYDYFNQIAHILGHQLQFVIGPQAEDNRYHMNRNYSIDPADLKQALSQSIPRRVQEVQTGVQRSSRAA